MVSIVKIYRDDLLPGQSKSFGFTVKGYKKVSGIILCGQGEVSLVFDRDHSVVADSFDLSTSKDVEPDKRTWSIQKQIEGDFVRGSMTKKGMAGRLSIYLIVE